MEAELAVSLFELSDEQLGRGDFARREICGGGLDGGVIDGRKFDLGVDPPARLELQRHHPRLLRLDGGAVVDVTKAACKLGDALCEPDLAELFVGGDGAAQARGVEYELVEKSLVGGAQGRVVDCERGEGGGDDCWEEGGGRGRRVLGGHGGGGGMAGMAGMAMTLVSWGMELGGGAV